MPGFPGQWSHLSEAPAGIYDLNLGRFGLNLLISSYLFRLPTNQPHVSPKPSMSFGQCQVVTSRPSSITKLQSKLLQMETGALKQGLARTHLTPDRLEVALSVMLTKEVPEPLRSHIIKIHSYCVTITAAVPSINTT